MDFGDYIYIILAIVFSVVGALSKKRTAKKPQAKSSRKRSVFEELFDVQTGVEDPVPQTAFVDQEPFLYDSEDDNLEEEKIDEQAGYSNELQEKLNSLYYNVPDEKVENTPLVVVKKSKPVSRHSLLDDLHQKSEIQKAVIYHEIMKRKF